MKVLQVVPRLESGGVEQGTLEIAEALVQSGHQAVVVSQGGPMVEALERIGALHVVMRVGDKSPRSFLTIRELQRLIRNEHIDIVHPRSRLPAWLCWLALRKFAPTPKFVTSVHGFHSVSRYSAVVTRGERVEVVSDSVRQYLVKNYRVNEKRIRKIYRGIDPDFYYPKYQPDKEWLDRWNADFPGNPVVLLLAGRLTRLKGHHSYFDVVNDLVRRGVDIRALVVGDAEEKRSAYESEIRSRVIRNPALKERVQFLGRREDLRQIMKMANVVLSLSTTPESFGRTTLEALSLGVPVVGFDHGGVGEILKVMFPQGAISVGDIDGICDAVENVIRVGQQTIVQRHPFLLSHMKEQTLAMYQELIS